MLMQMKRRFSVDLQQLLPPNSFQPNWVLFILHIVEIYTLTGMGQFCAAEDQLEKSTIPVGTNVT